MYPFSDTLKRGPAPFADDPDRRRQMAAEFDPAAFLPLLTAAVDAAGALVASRTVPPMVPGRLYADQLLAHLAAQVPEPAGHAELLQRMETAGLRAREAAARLETAQRELRQLTDRWNAAALEWGRDGGEPLRKAMDAARAQAQAKAAEVEAIDNGLQSLRADLAAIEAEWGDSGEAVETAKAVEIITQALWVMEAAVLFEGLAALCGDLVPAYDAALRKHGAKTQRDYRSLCGGVQLHYLSAERVRTLCKKFEVSLTQPPLSAPPRPHWARPGAPAAALATVGAE